MTRAFTALVNPISGGGRAEQRWAPVAARLAGTGADVRVERTRGAAHARELAASAAAAGRTVIAVGGDGLVRDAAAGIVGAGAPDGAALGIVPAGRGNDLVRRLRLPGQPADVAALLLSGTPRLLDVIDAGGAIVPGNVYAGIDSASNALINSSRRLPGLLAYRLAPVRAIATWRPPAYALTLDGRSRAVTAHTVVVANTGAYGHGLDIVPQARPDDGLLQVLIVSAAGPRRAIAAFLREARRGRHVDRPEVEVVTAREVRIAADRDVPLYGDGDGLGALPVTVRVRPGALPLLMP